MKWKDSELFRPLVDTTEKYLRNYCDGKQEDDERTRLPCECFPSIPKF
jgi:hypothetical protein